MPFQHPEWIKEIVRRDPDRFLIVLESLCEEKIITDIEVAVLPSVDSERLAKDALIAHLRVTEEEAAKIVDDVFGRTVLEVRTIGGV